MALTEDRVILVNEQDEALGTMDKMQAHREGKLHRAFSIFILNGKDELLLQQRAFSKYHSGGLWTNTCCSHPLPGEDTLAAAHRRLHEEMGLNCELNAAFILRYKAEVGNSLVENEYDHVYYGRYNGAVHINPSEAEKSRFMPLGDITEWLEREPGAFTAWFQLAWPKFIAYLQER